MQEYEWQKSFVDSCIQAKRGTKQEEDVKEKIRRNTRHAPTPT